MRYHLPAESGADSAMENPQVQSTRYSSLRLDRIPSPRSLYRSSSSRQNSSNDVSRTTTPIAMPSSSTGYPDHRPHPLAIPPSAPAAILEAGPQRFAVADRTASPIAKAARDRRTSISFDPKVRLDGGQQIPLQEPLSRVSAEYFSLSDPASPPPPPSTQEKPQSNLSAGLGMYRRQSPISPSLFVKPQEGSSRPRRRTSAASRFLGLPTEPEQPTSPIAITNSAVSLTSNSTVSSMTEFSTPPDSVDEDSIVGSPESIPVLHGIDPTAWTSPFPIASPFGPRNKSFTNFEQQRISGSRARRAMSERGGGRRGSVSSGISPASMFLSTINTSPQEEPSVDAEGLEIRDYVLGKQISFGGFSSVSEAFTIEGGSKKKYAVKIVRKQQDEDLTSFEQEVSLWRVLHHRHILPLVAVINTPPASYAFMELASGGSLFDLIKKNRQGISASRCQHYGFQLASALRYLHEDVKIVHGDVKLENCLLDMSRDREAGGHLYLADFGLARCMSNPHDDDGDERLPEIVHRSQSVSTAVSTGASQMRPESQRTNSLDPSNFAGSLPYASPEMINSVQPVLNPSVDIWAFATTIFALHTGMLPFNHSFLPKLQDMILKGEYDIEKLRKCWGLMEAGKQETDRVEEVIRGCLVIDPENRWGVKEVLESRWLRDMGTTEDE